MRYAKEEGISNHDHAIDFKSAVEGLHVLSSQELTKLLRDSESFTIQINTENGSLIQIDMERLAWSLPLHLVAVLVSPIEDDMNLRYLLCGIRLLHSLCCLASRHSRLEQILLEEVKVTEQILDLVFYLLVVLARYEQEIRIESYVPILHSTLVACSLHLLTGYISSQWQDLVHILLVHPKVDVFMDVTFDAIRVDIRFFQMKLSALNNEVLCKKYSPQGAERTALILCQQCEASLQFLQSLCQQKMFRERLLRNKELCKNGGILSLARAVLKLNIPQHFNESITIVAAISRWKSKVLSILLQLCETESISYLDEVASSPRSMHLAKSVALEVLELLKAAFTREPKEHRVSIDKANPKGLVILNSMRLADIFSDDSNFRSFIMTNITQVLADILALPHDEFLGSWCSTDLPVMEEDATLEYDPYTVAGVVLVSLTEGPGTVLSSCSPLKETSVPCSFILNNTATISHARQRTSFLVKIIANLHCFNPKICEEQERDQFVNKFLECLQLEPSKSSIRYTLTSDAQKASTICENLCSLCNHAVSLIPTLLNEEDVQLLSEFFDQLQALVPSVRYDNSVQDAQSTGGCGIAVGEARYFKDKSNSPNEEISKNSMLQEVGQFNATGMHMDLPDESPEMDRAEDKNTQSKSASGSFREADKDMCNVDSGSRLNPMKGRNCTDQMSDNGEFPNLLEHAKESGFRGMIEETDKVEASPNEERQPRKRKRNIMNLKQIALIEKALLDEPEMQRNASLLQSWADKLSVHGSELTSSQLKNWLNNRKARLARAAREARAPSEGENAYPDKPCGSSVGHCYDSPESPVDDFYVPLPTSRSSNQSTSKYSSGGMIRTSSETEMPSSDFVDFAAQQMDGTSSRYAQCEPGQCVSLRDGEGKEVGRGKVYQVEGRWQGKSLEETGTCIVDIHELKVEKWTKVPHPSEAAGTAFDEAEAKHGVMRVAWDAHKIYLLSQ
eukprot:TRINITY_DN7644_c0_g1_i3.p1 TRINITY_DN7644_c0_g1~~TRINITY_DN7644_c0_g1_i3.p1  ORF type:complete len:963 (+),score=190.58 TRINITY_DN7644_c0_g1_i3:340-3228(+)